MLLIIEGGAVPIPLVGRLCRCQPDTRRLPPQLPGAAIRVAASARQL